MENALNCLQSISISVICFIITIQPYFSSLIGCNYKAHLVHSETYIYVQLANNYFQPDPYPSEPETHVVPIQEEEEFSQNERRKRSLSRKESKRIAS